MSEYVPKYPSQEDDDSNKTSSELLAETLKPIYVPQDLMLAWESHLASYSRDTHVLLDQVKDSETALTTQYQVLLARVQKYEQMLQDITMDSNEFTMDADVVNFTGWNILAQASYWDYLLRKEITKLRDQIKSAEFKGELAADVSNSVLESLSTGNHYISNIIGALTDSPLIRDLDAALSGTSTGLSELRLEHEILKAKQYADAIALADQNGETFDQLTLTFNNLISEQIGRITDEAATRTRVFQELEDGITVESQLRHEGQETIATHVFALKASTDTSIAGIKKEYSTIAGTNEAITSALTTYTAEVDGTISTILTDYVAYANLDSALTSKTDKLLAIVNENIGKLNITNEIQAGLTSIKALSTVSVDLNGVVSGYGLISELENGIVKSAFGVNADTFYVGKPTDKVKPFVVTDKPTNIDGIDFPAGTWINSAIIADATIGTALIKDASITNAKINDLAVSNAKIANLAVDSAKIADLAVTSAKIENAAITTAKIDNLAVDSAKLADAAITTAKIGTLQVDSLHIKNRAVTVPLGIKQVLTGVDGTVTAYSNWQKVIRARVYGLELIESGNYCTLFYAIDLRMETTVGKVIYVDVMVGDVNLARISGASQNHYTDTGYWQHSNVEGGGPDTWIPSGNLVLTGTSSSVSTIGTKMTSFIMPAGITADNNYVDFKFNVLTTDGVSITTSGTSAEILFMEFKK